MIQYPLTIYYDAACPLCRSEMEALKAGDIDNKLILVDCSNDDLAMPASCPITQSAMMQRIHAVDANGKWINSIDVFIAAYAASNHKRLAALWANPYLRPALNRLYPWVADNRQWLSKTPLPYLINALLRFRL